MLSNDFSCKFHMLNLVVSWAMYRKPKFVLYSLSVMMPRLSAVGHGRALGMLEAGMTMWTDNWSLYRKNVGVAFLFLISIFRTIQRHCYSGSITLSIVKMKEFSTYASAITCENIVCAILFSDCPTSGCSPCQEDTLNESKAIFRICMVQMKYVKTMVNLKNCQSLPKYAMEI